MFLSCEYRGYEGYDLKTNEYRWRYKIIDSEWEAEGEAEGVAVAVIVDVPVDVHVDVGIAVIQEYSKRELPVAANLIRAFQWCCSKYGFSIQQIIDWNKQYNPQYKQYEEEVNRYLTLI